MDLDKIYTQMHIQGKESIIRENEYVDENLNNSYDTRRGIALIIRPSEKVIKSIQDKLKEIKNIENNIYIYRPECLHLTLYIFISQTKDFIYEKEQKELYKKISKEVLSNFKKFKISCRGLIFTNETILVKGFPEKTMNEIRNKIRETMYKNNVSLNEKYKNDICHISIARFKNKITNRKKLIQFVSDNYNYDFGSFDVSEIELIYHDKYDTKRDIFERFKLI